MCPRAASGVCPVSGCPEIVEGGGRCDTHKREYRRNQARTRRAAGDPSMSTYSTAAWRKRRAEYLNNHPDCADCGRPATDVDHVIPRRLLIERGIHQPDDDRWLQALCSDCHHSKSATLDGALGRAVTPIEER